MPNATVDLGEVTVKVQGHLFRTETIKRHALGAHINPRFCLFVRHATMLVTQSLDGAYTH